MHHIIIKGSMYTIKNIKQNAPKITQQEFSLQKITIVLYVQYLTFATKHFSLILSEIHLNYHF